MVESSDEENANMIEVPLTAALKQALLDRQEGLGRNGLRVIGMCLSYPKIQSRQF